MKKKIVLVIMAIALMVCSVVGLAACGGQSAEVTITGSSSVSPLMQKLAAAYESQNKNVTIKITTSDSSTGVQDTIDGKNDFGMASRDLKSAEVGVESEKIANDGVVLIVNNEVSSITNVTSQQVYDLFASGTAIGSITGAISREEGSGTRDAFDGLITNGSGSKLSSLASFASCVDTQTSTGYVMTEIASSSNKMGYISLGSLNNTVKALSFNGIEATAANVKNGTYSLARPFNIITKTGKKLSEEAQGFIDFILSEAGQKIVSDNGYVTI